MPKYEGLEVNRYKVMAGVVYVGGVCIYMYVCGVCIWWVYSAYVGIRYAGVGKVRGCWDRSEALHLTATNKAETHH